MNAPSAGAVNIEPRNLKDLITYRLARLQAKMNAHATRVLKDNSGLTLMQWRVLVVLNTYAPSTITQITRLTEFDKALISRTVQSLVSQKLISSKADKSDLRQHNLKLTAKGRRVYAEAAPAMFARQSALSGALTDEQHDALFDALDRLEAATNTFDES